MKLERFNKKLLYFLYSLTKEPRIMKSDDLARKIKQIDGSKVSGRTVRRWFSFLQGSCFDYYYYIKYESLGLVTAYVIVKGQKDLNKILNKIPLHDYATYVFDTKSMEEVVLLRYLIPIEKIKEFENHWSDFYDDGLVRRYWIHYLSTPTMIYSPFHKTISREGEFSNDNVKESDYDFFFKLLYKNLNTKRVPKVDDAIKENPLILPVLLSQSREHWASTKIWKDMKEKLGSSVWNYIGKVKKETDNVGTKRVQKCYRDIFEKHRDKLIQQVRVEYDPIILHKNITSFLFLDFPSNNSRFEFTKELAKKSLITYVYPHYGHSNKTMFFFVSSNSLTRDILSELVVKYSKKSISNRILWRNKKKIGKIWGRHTAKLNYANLFDPDKCKWKADMFKKVKEKI
jgi:hypothetical protein